MNSTTKQLRKVLLDTSAWISAFGQRPDRARVDRATRVLQHLERNPARFVICYSQRTQNELSGHATKSAPDLSGYVLLPYHSANETWDQIEGTWENIGTRWGDAQEIAAADSLLMQLPDKKKKSNRRDRGIFGDAVIEKCVVILHENPKDFSRFATYSKAAGILLIDLLDHSAEDIVRMLES